MNHSHTPGPWYAGEPQNDDDWQHDNPTRCGGCDIVIIAPHPTSKPYRMSIATVYDNPANARLIAAAPALLAACKDIADCAENPSQVNGDILARIASVTRSAIALAQEGK